MTGPEIASALSSHPFLHGLSEAHVDQLAGCARLVGITAGQYFGREKEPADALYLIQSGRVGIEIHTPDRGAVRIETIGPGDIVGWSWLVPPHRWQFDARVLDPLQVITLHGPSLRDKCERDHELGYQLLKRLLAVIARRLAGTRLQLLDVYR